jgi:hypothetical protein
MFQATVRNFIPAQVEQVAVVSESFCRSPLSHYDFLVVLCVVDCRIVGSLE